MIKRFTVVVAMVAIAGLTIYAGGQFGNHNRQPDDPALLPAEGPARVAVAPPLAKEEAGKRAAAVATRARSAFVKVEHASGKHLGGEAAVIVSADGYILYRNIVGRGTKNFILSDGRRATGTPLGWSSEWGIGLVKLDGPGPWPHVELAQSDGLRANQWVFTLGYPRFESEQPDRAILKVESVNGSAVGRWFVLNDGGGETAKTRNTPATFDLDGRLVGVGWKPWLDGDIGTIYTDAKVIRDVWKELAAGKNLDEHRLRGQIKGSADGGRSAVDITPAVEAKAKAATVCIRLKKGQRGWSGTVVTAGGVVVTCAHALGFVMPGTQVIVSLPDGRDAAGQIVGYNHVSDVCEVKITDPGPWPYVEVGDSTRMRAGDPCLMVGYGPGKDNARQPFPRRTTVAPQWSHKWNYDLDMDPNLKWRGGDSGGGVFDADGRLVAYFLGERGPSEPGQYGRRVEVFKAHRDEMGAPYERGDAPAPTGKPGG